MQPVSHKCCWYYELTKNKANNSNSIYYFRFLKVIEEQKIKFNNQTNDTVCLLFSHSLSLSLYLYVM